MSDNRSARQKLEIIYGKKCMIHNGIRKINPPKVHEHNYKGKPIPQQLTFHHLKPKSKGGRATVENGALLCRSCHDWLEQLTVTERELVNNELRKYKEEFKRCKVELVDSLDLDFSVNTLVFEPQDVFKEKRTRKKEIAEKKARKYEDKEFKRLKREYEDR